MLTIYPAVALRDAAGPARPRHSRAIEHELAERLASLRNEGKLLEAQRLEQRTLFDLEMIEEIGFCHGIENYCRHLRARARRRRPRRCSTTSRDFLLWWSTRAT